MEKREITEIKQELKNLFTGYWHYLSVQTACKLSIFDEIENGFDTVVTLNRKIEANFTALSLLLNYLIDSNYIISENGNLHLTERGKLLTARHPETLKNACILWGDEHLGAWKNLKYTIETGKSAFEKVYNMPVFDFMISKPKKLLNYQLAMAEYASDDYRNIADAIDFSEFKTIVDLGGGLGTLLKFIALKNNHLDLVLFELPQVIQLIENKEQQPFRCIGGGFFSRLKFKADALILSRILHDWNAIKATKILKNCYHALTENGKLFVIEIMNDKIQANLLSLNMLALCESYERTYEEYSVLLKSAGFKIENTLKLNDLQTIIVATK